LTLAESGPYPRADFTPIVRGERGSEHLANADVRVAVPTGERQYHIGLGPGELADYILLPGDQDRVERVAERFESVERTHRHREFASATGLYKGLRVSCVSTGIGTDNVEIVISEILAITNKPTFIRIGSCGALQDGMQVGDLVISTGSVRLETTTSWFVHEGYPALAHHEAILALVEAAEGLGLRYHAGISATAPGFYGAQGRPIPQLPIRYPDFADEMTRQGILNFEMEASAVLVLAGLGGCRAGAVCAVYANRRTGEFAEGDIRDRAEAAVIDTGLESLRVLAALDRQTSTAGAARWRPSLWTPS
jgi:uridine phosphorylase